MVLIFVNLLTDGLGIVLPANLVAQAIRLCAIGSGVAGSSPPASYAINIHSGAILTGEPNSAADAAATVRDLIGLGADFEAGPLAINGRDFATYGVTPTSVFDACALVRVEENAQPAPNQGSATVSGLTAMLRHAFGARITDTIRPMNARYGARYSWHKFGQAIDFVPAGGVGAINRAQIRGLMNANGVRLIELLGPGDRGHADHWHVAFARPGQVVDHLHPVEEDEDWIVTVSGADAPHVISETAAPIAPAPVAEVAAKAPPQWDVFGRAEWRAIHGGGS